MTSAEFSSFIKKNPLSLACGVISLLLIGTGYLRSDEIGTAEALLAEKTALAERYALNIKYSAQLKEQVEILAAANAEVDSRVVRASQLGTNTQYFYKLQSDTGVNLIDFRQATGPSSTQKPAKGNFIPIAFNISIQGTFVQLMNFLRQLESGSHYCRILTATCSGNAAIRSQPLTLSLSVEILGLP
jgi:hypothetical protein